MVTPDIHFACSNFVGSPSNLEHKKYNTFSVSIQYPAQYQHKPAAFTANIEDSWLTMHPFHNMTSLVTQPAYRSANHYPQCRRRTESAPLRLPSCR